MSKTRPSGGPRAKGRQLWLTTAAIGIAVAAGSCQDYEYVFQPKTDRVGAHLRFVVEQPSKADILFVIDNSSSMA